MQFQLHFKVNFLSLETNLNLIISQEKNKSGKVKKPHISIYTHYSQGRGHLKSAHETAEIKTTITSANFLKIAGQNWGLEDLNINVIKLEDIQLTFKDKIKGLFWLGSPAKAQAPAVLVFTSGTEGQPKGVALRHQNLMANILHAISIVEVNIDDILFNAMPGFHAFGLNAGLILPIIAGLRVFVYVNPLHIKVIPELIYDTRATIIIGSDSFADIWARNAHPYDFRRVRFALLGAEKVQTRTLERYFHHLNLRLYEGYGVTEGSPVIAINTPMRVRDGSVGHLLPGLEYKLEPVPGLTASRFLIKGPNIMMGYMRPEKPGYIEPLKDGWHDTGDLVEIDPEGFVWIKGRCKRFAKIRGEMVSLALIEEIASKVWPETKSVVLSRPDEFKGERLIFITTDPAPELSLLRQAIKAQGLTDLSVPKMFLTVPEIPLTPLGKPNLPLLDQKVEELLKNQS